MRTTYTFSRTIPLAWEAPPKGLAFHRVPKWAFLKSLSAHRWSRRWLTCFLAVRRPLGLPRREDGQVEVRIWQHCRFDSWRGFGVFVGCEMHWGVCWTRPGSGQSVMEGRMGEQCRKKDGERGPHLFPNFSLKYSIEPGFSTASSFTVCFCAF